VREPADAARPDEGGWAVPVVPGPEGPAADVRTYHDARLTAYDVRRGDPADPLRYLRGAVHTADGELVAASQRSGGHRGDLVRSADPPRLPPRAPRGRRLAGRWLYGGHWMGQFGHFITETLTTLWPQDPGVRGIVFHRFLSPPDVLPWQLDLVRRAGWSLPVRVVDGPAVVDELVVPSRPLVLNQHAGSRALEVWRRVRAGVDVGTREGGRLLFLSRSRLAADGRRTPGDEGLDGLLAGLGADVVHPQEVPVAEQLAAVAAADVLVGVSGSALHLSAFAPRRTAVLEVGDGRRLREPLYTQDVIDGALGHVRALVPLLRDGGPDGPRDLGATARRVEHLLTSLPSAR